MAHGEANEENPDAKKFDDRGKTMLLVALGCLLLSIIIPLCIVLAGVLNGVVTFFQ